MDIFFIPEVKAEFWEKLGSGTLSNTGDIWLVYVCRYMDDLELVKKFLLDIFFFKSARNHLMVSIFMDLWPGQSCPFLILKWYRTREHRDKFCFLRKCLKPSTLVLRTGWRLLKLKTRLVLIIPAIVVSLLQCSKSAYEHYSANFLIFIIDLQKSLLLIL